MAGLIFEHGGTASLQFFPETHSRTIVDCV